MSRQVQISVDQEIYDRLTELRVPPIADLNGVIKALLFEDGRDSPAAIAVTAGEQHYTLEDEQRRAQSGIYDGSGICC